jgi:hypothetical protein
MKMDLSILFDSFGLCPEYKVVWVDGDYVSYYNPVFQDFSSVLNNEDGKSTFEYNRKEKYLDYHSAILENGKTVSARFTVAHELKTIFLKVSIGGIVNGEIVKITSY